MFRAFRTGDQPTTIKFATGREEPLPDLTSVMKPSALGDMATYTLLGFGGLFLGGETGLVTGSFRARSFVSKDPESQQRIEKAFRRYGPGLSCYVRALANASLNLQLSSGCSAKASRSAGQARPRVSILSNVSLEVDRLGYLVADGALL